MNMAVKAFEEINILHKCTGGSVVEDNIITEVELEVWDRTIPLDLKGTMYVADMGTRT